MAVRNPLVEQILLGGNLTLDGEGIEEARRWGNSLIRSRDAWADLNRHGRRYSDRDAPASPVRAVNKFGAR